MGFFIKKPKNVRSEQSNSQKKSQLFVSATMLFLLGVFIALAITFVFLLITLLVISSQISFAWKIIIFVISTIVLWYILFMFAIWDIYKEDKEYDRN